MKYLLKQHPEWHELGLAYDCGSSLYTSERLVFPRSAGDADVDVSHHTGEFTEGPQYQEDITWPNSQTINLKVVIAPVSLIVPPIEGTATEIVVSCGRQIPNLWMIRTNTLSKFVFRRALAGGRRHQRRRCARCGERGDNGQAPPHRCDGAGRRPAVLRALESGGPHAPVDPERQQGVPVRLLSSLSYLCTVQLGNTATYTTFTAPTVLCTSSALASSACWATMPR